MSEYDYPVGVSNPLGSNGANVVFKPLKSS
jgi:hypothetical protein